MAVRKSTKLSIDFRGAKLQFGIHKPTGQYRKKYKGRTLYLGNNPDGVLEQWIAKTDDIEAEEDGTIEIDQEALTVGGLCNLFLATKKAMTENGELSLSTYNGYHSYCKRLIKFFGRTTLIAELKPADFARLRTDFSKAKPQKIGRKINKKATQKPLSLVGLKTKVRNT